MSSDIVVIGAGGHAKVCIDLLRQMGERVACCVGGRNESGTCVGVPILGGDAHLLRLREQGISRAFVAVGDNRVRIELAGEASARGFQLVNAISPSAVISPSVRFGLGVAVMAGCVVNADSEIADLTIVNTGATIDHDCRIGTGAHVGPQCALAGSVAVGSLSFLGVGCAVIPGKTIGERVTLGAGAVVVCDIPDDVTAVGVPARVVERGVPISGSLS